MFKTLYNYVYLVSEEPFGQVAHSKTILIGKYIH